tara:strand:- start:261 stop:515 length:255 start_codon:yes stop_codon:yes gene_type:complete
MEKIRIRCRSCGKELEGHSTKTYSCGCPNMTTIRGDNITGKDLSLVTMLNSSTHSEKDSLTPVDLQWQEERRKRKVRKLDFEVR